MLNSASRLWVAAGLVVCVRACVLFLGLDSLHEDPDAYARLATTWARTGVLGVESVDGSTVTATAFRPPLYPWLLSLLADSQGALAVDRIAVLHFILGVATVGLTWSVAGRLHFPWPELPACCVALDPLLLRASQLVMTETLAAFLAVAAWRLWLALIPSTAASFGDSSDPLPACAVPNAASPPEKLTEVPSAKSCRLGLIHSCGSTAQDAQGRTTVQWLSLLGLAAVLGASVLARPTAGPWVALCVLGALFLSSSCWKRRLNDSLILSLLVAACLSPWVLRNMAQFGQPIWATTHGGYTLLLANNPLLYEHFRINGPSREWDAEPFHARWAQRDQRGLPATPSDPLFWSISLPPTPTERVADERTDDARAYSAAWSTIARDRSMFAISSIYRLGWLWALWPNTGPSLSRWIIGLWYTSMFVLALVGLRLDYRRRGLWLWLKIWWLPLALALTLSLLHAIYWSNMRMRAPVMAMVYVAASVACGGSRRDPQ
jgi:hypothetical protein